GRRIACADFYEYIYNDCNLEMKSSDTNDDWDNDNLVAYSNLIKSWDYYDSHGWTSPNGTDSPTLLLVDACKRDGTLYDNAFYCDNCFGWYMFAIGYPTYGMALDSIAHEYTHAFTGTSMNITFYKNDSGAIDEAISDILGNIIEEVYTGKNDPDWNIGEDSGTTLRCASDPHKFCYPEHVWDKFYVMNVADPFVLVDNGGVHVNSNILYRIAYKLVKEGSMTYEEATQLWMTADYMRTYVTDFKQLSVILPYLTDAIGMSRYTPLIEQYIDEARLSEKCMPEKLDENTAFVTLTLPDTEEFSDNQWCLYVFTEGPYEGYSSDYRFNEDNSEHDEGDSRNTFFMGGESYDGRISLIAEPGFSQVVLYHIDPETGEVDRMFNYGDDKWAEIENVAYGTYQLLEGYNVLSQEGLTAGDNG
ncbi:MAG: M4 family metallopeptidase, partial [Ruminiclostridium sp.]|nr:M4 family metallopeptidase [Ruminiclostridium sp.]